MPEAWRRGSVLLPGLSPLLSLGGALAARAAGVLTLLGLPLLILPLFAGRFFCWRLCPMGFAAETVSRINRRNTGWIRKIPFVGKGLALLILGSAAAGWPVLIWTDPLSVFNGFFAAARQPLTWLSAATASGFILILLASLIVPNLWCHRLCPLGGLQEWLSQLGKSLRSARCAKEGDEIPPLLTHARTGRRVFLGFALGGVSGSLYRAYAPRRVTTDTDCGGTHSCGGRHGHGPGEGEAGQRRADTGRPGDAARGRFGVDFCAACPINSNRCIVPPLGGRYLEHMGRILRNTQT